MKLLFSANAIAFRTIVHKEISRILRIWIQSLIPPVIVSVLYFVIFGNLIGSRIGTIEGFTYMQFITPGLIMMNTVNNAYSNVVASFYSARFQHSVEEILVSPTPNVIILMGFVMGGMARGLLVGALVTVVALFFTHLTIHHVGIMLTMWLLSAMLFALMGFTNAMFARNFDDISIIPTFVLTPLNYLGGVFYSISMLPEFWQHVSKANPILYMVNTFRYSLLGISDVSMTAAFSIVTIAVVALFSFNLRLLNRGSKLRS